MGSPPDEYFNTVTLPYWKTNNDNNDNTKISKLANAYHSHGVQVKYCGTCHIWNLQELVIVILVNNVY